MILLENLPEELLLNILWFLPFSMLIKSISLVNKRFHRLSQDPILWTKITISDNGAYSIPKRKAITNWMRNVILPRCTQLQELRIRTLYDWLRIAQNALNNSTKLRVLELECSPLDCGMLTEELVQCIGKHKSIRQIRLRKKEFFSMRRETFVMNIKCFSRLTHFDLPGIFRWDDECINLLVDNCSNLKHLDLSNAKEISDRGVLKLFTTLGHNLSYLSLNGAQLTDASLSTVADYTSLLSLSICNCVRFSSLTLTAISRLSKLTQLKLGNLKLNPDNYIQAFKNEQFSQLEKFHLWAVSGFNDEALKTIVDNCPKLSQVYLRCCFDVSSQGIQNFMDALYKSKAKVTHLEFYNMDCLTFSQLKEIPQSLPHLQYLSNFTSTWFYRINISSLRELVKNGNGKWAVTDSYGANIKWKKYNKEECFILR